MKLNANQRKLLKEHEDLSGSFKGYFDRWGLNGCLLLLDELLNQSWDLNNRLEKIDADHQAYIAQCEKRSDIEGACPDRAAAELISAIQALNEVTKMKRTITSDALERLRTALLCIVHDSSPPGMLMPTERSNRPFDSPAVQMAKGLLAAAAYAQHKSAGISRKQAASWVLRHTAPEFLRCISRKPIKERTVMEWIDRYSCKLISPRFGEAEFSGWTRHFAVSNITGDGLKGLTKNYALRLPVLFA